MVSNRGFGCIIRVYFLLNFNIDARISKRGYKIRERRSYRLASSALTLLVPCKSFIVVVYLLHCMSNFSSSFKGPEIVVRDLSRGYPSRAYVFFAIIL